MRTKVTLVLIFLNVALFFFIFKLERLWLTEPRARDARSRARAIAAEAGASVGPITNADTGIFQITAPNSTRYSAAMTFRTFAPAGSVKRIARGRTTSW